LTDERTYRLSSFNACYIEENDDGNMCIRLYHLYLEQAEHTLYWMNVCDPIPEFAIFTGDIPSWLMDALAGLNKVAMKRIITNTVRRIYESVDPEFFHTNGIYGKIRWRFVSEPEQEPEA
jgi:hypothetical protein